MSFTSDVRQELARLDKGKDCCALAEIAGFVRASGNLRLVGGGKYKLLISTDSPAIARRFKSMIQDYFSVDIDLQMSLGSKLKKTKTYILSVGPDQRSEEILRRIGILLIRGGMNYISDGIHRDIIKTKCCKKAYLRGLFLAVGIISSPEKEYHYELVCNSKNLAEDVKRLINCFRDIHCKVVPRKNDYIAYLKEAEQISDMLALMGASTQIFVFEETRIRKEIRNKANRINNCDQANIDKTLSAAEKHIENIKLIDREIGLENISPKLQEVAALRIENPDLSLVELGELLNPPLKKSGVNKRLMKIGEIADKYR